MAILRRLSSGPQHIISTACKRESLAAAQRNNAKYGVLHQQEKRLRRRDVLLALLH